MRGWSRFAVLCIPVPAVILSMPGWIERLTAIAYPPHSRGVVVISGASTGIGRHAALSLDAAGFTVLAGVRTQADADSLTAVRATVRPVLLDVTDEASCRAAADTAARTGAELGLPVVGLVNNAGVSGRLPLEIHPLNRIRKIMDVNVIGATALTQAMLPHLREANGRVINVGSLAGLVAMPGSGAYSASKAALEAVSDALRLELGPQGISVSIVEPGYVKTAIAAKQMIGDDVDAASAALGLHEGLKEVYAPYLEGLDARRMAAERKADQPTVTSSAIAHALMSPYPRTRYPVASAGGMPAWVVAWLAWILPDRLQDKLLLAREPWVATVARRGAP